MKRILNFSLLTLLLLGCQSNKSLPLDAEGFATLINDEMSLQLVDVRTPQEYQSGHLKDALLIDMYSPDFNSRIETLNKDQPIAVYCAVGQRSYAVFEMLQERGFKQVYHLEGGIQAWASEGKPISFD